MPLALCHRGPWVPEFLPTRLQPRICQWKHWCGRSPGCSCNSASKCVHGDCVITPMLVWREPKSPPWFTEMPASCCVLQATPMQPPADGGRVAQPGWSSSWTSTPASPASPAQWTQTSKPHTGEDKWLSKPLNSGVVTYASFFLATAA